MAGGEGRPREARSLGTLLLLDVLLQNRERSAAAGDDAVRPAPEHRLAVHAAEVLGVTVASHRDLERLLAGFDQAYDARRRRVPGGKSPAEIVKERLRQDRGLANAGCRPPFDPCALPRAMLVIERAKDVSQPDN